MYRPVIVNEYNRHGRLYGSVLECVVENDQVGFRHILMPAFSCLFRGLKLFRVAKEAASLSSGLIHSYGDKRESPLYLHGFITIFMSGTFKRNLLESLAAALVSAREYGQIPASPYFILKESLNDHFSMWSLSGSSYCDVADTDGRDLRTYGFPDSSVE